jgi:hypothetical protein
MAKPSSYTTGWDTIPVRGGEGPSVEVTRYGAPVTGSSSRVPLIPIHSWNQGLSRSFVVDIWPAAHRQER